MERLYGGFDIIKNRVHTSNQQRQKSLNIKIRAKGELLMGAMILSAPRQPVRLAELSVPKPNSEQVLIRIHACAVCRTDLHIVDGELTHPKLPLVLGHQIVSTVEAIGQSA